MSLERKVGWEEKCVPGWATAEQPVVARCSSLSAPPQCLYFADRLPASCRADSFPSHAECSGFAGVVVNHHHFIVILFGDGESRSVPIDLMGTEVSEGPIRIDFGNGTEERLLRFCFQVRP